MKCEVLLGHHPHQMTFNLSPQINNQSSPNLQNHFISYNPHLKKQQLFSKISSSGAHKSRTTMAGMNTFAPPQQTTTEQQSFYQLLGISESGTLSEIKKAYKQLARKYHPDVSPADQTEEFTQRFILVREAYETLSDPQTRALYDRDLSKGLHFAFSPTRGCYSNQRTEERGDWKSRWQSQLNELKYKSMKNDSWGARMRMQTSESFSD